MLYAAYLHTTDTHPDGMPVNDRIIQVFESEEIAAAFCYLYNARNRAVTYYYQELYISRDVDTWGMVAEEGEIQAILASPQHKAYNARIVARIHGSDLPPLKMEY